MKKKKPVKINKHPLSELDQFFRMLPKPDNNFLLHKKAEKVLKWFLKKTENRKNLLFVFVFGSFAKRKMKPDSDIDVVIVRKKAKFLK